MKYSLNDLQKAVIALEGALSVAKPEIRAVLATELTPSLILPDEDCDYSNVYLFNVPSGEMLAVEDAAYDAWESVRPDADASVCFFFYTPEETAAKFPAYVAKKDAMNCISVLAAKHPKQTEWRSNGPLEEPCHISWLLVEQLQRMAQIPGGARQTPHHSHSYRTHAPAMVEPCDELLIAA